MTRLTALALDLSKLPPPQVIETLDEELLKAAFVERYKVLYAQKFGVPYTVDMLETDSAIEIGEALAGLRNLDRARVNDAAKAVLLAHATGANLDNIGAFFGVDRMTGEDDDRYRVRIQAAPDAYSSAGTVGAYIFHAMTADLRVKKGVGVRSPRAGAVLVSILSAEAGNGTPGSDVLKAVRDRLNRSDIKPLTVELVVQAAVITEIDAAYTLLIPAGPDETLIRAAAEASVRAYAADRHAVGRVWRWDGALAAVKVAGVEKVLAYSQSADIDPGADGAVYMRSLAITSQVGS